MRTASVLVFLLSLAPCAHAEWLPQKHPAAPETSFRAVQALDANVVWAGGSNGACLRTLDGGKTWQKLAVPGAEALDFRGLAVLDKQTAVLVSAGEAEKGKARIYRTADGGKTWAQTFSTEEKGAFLDGVRFWDAKNGIVFGDPVEGAWYLLVTSDGGKTWKRVGPKGLPAMQPNEAAFAASNSTLVVHGRSEVWIASGGGARSRVFRSQDRGQTWAVADTPMASGATTGIFGLFFWSATHGIGVGGDYKQEQQASNNIIVTSDGGATWRTGTPTDPPGLKETAVSPSEHVLLAIGPSGTALSSDRGSTWKKVDMQAVHAASCARGQCWAVGGKGAIARWK